MAKVNVSLPDELLADVDDLARELDRSRSGLVQEATAQYVAHVREEQAAEKRRADIQEAMDGMRALGEKYGSFPDSTEVIRRDRDRITGDWTWMMSSPCPRAVVDSSVVVKWFVAKGEGGVAAASAMRDSHRDGDIQLAAPSFLVLEVLNALRHRGYSAEDMMLASERLDALHLELAPLESLAGRAGWLAATHGLTVYDAAFVALAESLDAELVTADRRLAACTACRTRLLGS